MKPAPFVHHAPRTVDEAVAVLGRGRPRRQGARRRAEPHPGAQHAPGQPRPPRRHQRRRPGWMPCDVTDAWVRVGALVRHAGLERHDEAHAALPLLRQAAAQRRAPGDPQPRHHGGVDRARRPRRRDALGAGADRRCRRGRRARRTARDRRSRLLRGAARDDAAPTTSWSRPCGSGGSRPAPARPSVESARRHGDYALAGVAVAVEVDERRGASARARRSCR